MCGLRLLDFPAFFVLAAPVLFHDLFIAELAVGRVDFQTGVVFPGRNIGVMDHVVADASDRNRAGKGCFAPDSVQKIDDVQFGQAASAAKGSARFVAAFAFPNQFPVAVI